MRFFFSSVDSSPLCTSPLAAASSPHQELLAANIHLGMSGSNESENRFPSARVKGNLEKQKVSGGLYLE